MIMQTGHIYSLTIKSTVILELEVMTELTEDEFYDNGNIAENIAALLGINPKKIKIMDVVRLVLSTCPTLNRSFKSR